MDAKANPIYIVNAMGQTPQMIVFGPANENSPPPNERLKYSDQRIHPDDTIETIKRKILLELQTQSSLSLSYDELYLFASVQPFLTVERTIRLLTCGHRFPLSRDRMMTLCQNLKSPHLAEALCDSIGTRADKTEYTADELSEFLLAVQDSDDLRMDVPLGQGLQYDYPMPANPFEPVMDPFLKKAHHDLVITKNKTVLLEYGMIHDNVIHVCVAADVLAARGGTDDAELIKLYFPYLHEHEKGIRSREQLAEHRQTLLDETRPHIDDAFIKHNEAVNLLYNVYAGRQQPDELRYSAQSQLASRPNWGRSLTYCRQWRIVSLGVPRAS